MRTRIIVGTAIATAGFAAFVAARRWSSTWGVDPVEQAKALPGDEIVPDATVVDTRGITIDAPPDAVWPWLVQMGFGRGGWYSYDQLDMQGKSAERIIPEFQQLAVGDVVPTDPGGGFVVKVLEPEKALVLLVDTEIVAARNDAAFAGMHATDAPGLAASGRFLQTATPPQFSASWAFALEPSPGGRTRFIERFRVRYEAETPASRLMGPMLDFGVFVMMQRQMEGLRRRAEALARERGTGPGVATLATANGHAGQAAVATVEAAETSPAT